MKKTGVVCLAVLLFLSVLLLGALAAENEHETVQTLAEGSAENTEPTEAAMERDAAVGSEEEWTAPAFDGEEPAGDASPGNTDSEYATDTDATSNEGEGARWISEDGKRYYLNAKGKLVVGFQPISGAIYYFDNSGVLQYGWQTVGGDQYYFGSDGVMRTGKVEIDGQYRYFEDDGVYIPFGIITHPRDVLAPLGTRVTFTVEAAGDDLTYQWYYKNPGSSSFKALSGATKASYSFTLSETNAGRQVCCEVTDAAGNSAESEIATAIVKLPLIIVTQPADQIADIGDRVTFTVEATGNDLQYQWYYKSATATRFSPVNSGGTEATYSFKLSAANAGRQVYCEVIDAMGDSVESEIVTANVRTPLAIRTQPQDALAVIGEKVTFTVEAAGDGLTYQWYYKNPGSNSFKALSGATKVSYSFVLSETNAGRQVYCVLTDAYGNTDQSDTAAAIAVTPLEITAQPTNQTAETGQRVTFSIEASGDDLSYQWYYKSATGTSFSAVSNALTPTYSFKLSAANSGRRLYCVVTDGRGNTEQSETVMAIAADGPTIVLQPTDQAAALSERVTVAVEVTGEGLTYQWYYKNASATKFSAMKSGGDAASYSLKLSEKNAGRQLYCVITDSEGRHAVSDTVTVTVREEEPPVPVTPTPVPTGASDPYSVAQSMVGMNIVELYSAIGQPNSSNYSSSCLVIGGEDGILYYSGFVVETIRYADGSEVILGVYSTLPVPVTPTPPPGGNPTPTPPPGGYPPPTIPPGGNPTPTPANTAPGTEDHPIIPTPAPIDASDS